MPPNIALAQPAAQIGSRVPPSEHSPPAVRNCARTHTVRRWHNTAVPALERPVYRQVDKNNVPPQTLDQCAAAARANLWHSYERGGGGPNREQRTCHSKRRLAGSLTPIYGHDAQKCLRRRRVRRLRVLQVSMHCPRATHRVHASPILESSALLLGSQVCSSATIHEQHMS